MKQKLYKSLPKDMSPNGHRFVVGKWYKHERKLEICHSGYHCSENIVDAMGFVDCEWLAEVETRGNSTIQDDKQCWQEMKIVKRWRWTKPMSVRLAIYSAELVLKNYEKKYPDDMRPREAIEAAKKVLRENSQKNRSAAASAARSAESAAWSAAWSAESAAWSAESAESAARSAASAARSAAWSAESAASAASAAASAAWSAESAASAASAAKSAAKSAAASAWSATKQKMLKKIHNYIVRELLG